MCIMIQTGLVSVTFRKLSPSEIVNLVANAGMDAIEWGGDIHVPHGDLRIASQVGKITRDAGLRVAAYGSYYAAGKNDPALPFEKVLESALALGAPVIRVWAGQKGTSEANENDWNRIIEDSERIVTLAAKNDIGIAYEYHSNTLTDTLVSTKKLLERVGKGIKTYWQPSISRNPVICLQEISELAEHILNIHVYHWKDYDRLLLSEGAEVWKQYLETINRIPGEHYAMLEFVKDDNTDNFIEDAKVLKRILS